MSVVVLVILIVVAVVLLMAGVILALQLPEIRRYRKIKGM